MEAPLKPGLEGVPETLLWTLYHRAVEARRPDGVLDDPRAVELVDAIDYPFAERFGSGEGPLSQWQALRVLRFDAEVRRFLAEHPDGTVIDRQAVVARSALDRRWMDKVDASRGVLITAQGLFMYLEFEAVIRLLAACAKRFRGSALVFDAVPRWLSEASRKGRLGKPGGYQPPRLGNGASIATSAPGWARASCDSRAAAVRSSV